MRVSHMRVGFRLDGIAIVRIDRLNHLRRITLSDGTVRIERQSQDLPDVSMPTAVIPAGRVASKPMGQVTNVRASDKTWQGEEQGKKGERFRCKTSAYALRRGPNGRGEAL